ncbi:hypothetical protein GGI25_000950 [Coemansia spiralis]|uniref:VWFA domain-containing protein n=2 Tax=Coemansia TaxID=4863 RepID=A0A9W8L0R2_9FUNG|nr:hypothetical protein BX070DRAFT_88052 [Coemansia spiralis]KAJ2623185.1 hypothetical protein GGI26_002599 [Coemansia sp. RSA 1358]KAJ2680062.1 hypothetical protein GGI25_000950 [Coemansia spiralis]
MIFAFLIDTSVSMEQELSTALPTASGRKGDELSNHHQQPNDSLFGGEKDGLNRRWQRKCTGSGTSNTKTHKNTRLECAKSIVEQIITNRQFFETDRYMLITYGGAGGACIKANLKDSRATLLAELRKLEAKDRFSGGTSLTALFNQLSLMRSAYDLDTYGYGRYPALNEPVHIVWLTDGASMVTPNGVQNKLNLPVNNTPWVEAYVEPFRWDQRLILLFLHDQGDSALCGNKRHSSENTLLPMCSVMGGTAHHIGSMQQAQRFVESFAVARAVPNSNRPQGSAMANVGVLVNFERIDDNPANPGNLDLRVLLHVAPSTITNAPLPPPNDSNIATNGLSRAPGNVNYGNSAGVSALISGHLGYFPIPEAFWPETINPPRNAGGPSGPNQQQQQQQPSGTSNTWQITRRSAHPTLGYSQSSVEWAVPHPFPFDKYLIDASSNVAQKLLAAAQAAQTAHEAQGGKGQAKPVCWPVFVNGSYTTSKNCGFPFGLLRPNSARTAVNLFVLPYNFSALWKILGKLDVHVAGQNPNRNAIAMSPNWRREFEEYLQHTPGYYAIPLKRAFNLYGVPHGVFPKSFGQNPGMRNIAQYSTRIHSIARKEWDRVHPISASESSSSSGIANAALNLQHALLSFDPASDASHLVSNAFDVDRAHCLATLGAMRRVFVRECMATQNAYFRANSVVPPLVFAATVSLEQNDDKERAMDIDGGKNLPYLSQQGAVTSPYLPPVASMEYSLYGFPQALKKSPASPQLAQFGDSRSPFGALGRQRNHDPDLQQLGPGMQLSPLGGLVDVASEDDRDSRHSVPIRDMGEYGAAMHRMKTYEARDPLLDERTALQQRRNMFGNPYRRPLREPRGPTNNVLARNPELSAKLGLSRSNTSRTTGGTASPAATALSSSAGSAGCSNSNVSNVSGGAGSAIGTPRADADDEAGGAAGLEMESEAEVNEFAIDKMFEDMPIDVEDSGRNAGGSGGSKFSWMQRRNVPRRRSINAPWRKNDDSWNVNPWALLTPVDENTDSTNGQGVGGGNVVADPGALTYTSDALIINKHTSQVIKSASTSANSSPAQSTGQGTMPLMPPQFEQQEHEHENENENEQEENKASIQLESNNSSGAGASSQDKPRFDTTKEEDLLGRIYSSASDTSADVQEDNTSHQPPQPVPVNLPPDKSSDKPSPVVAADNTEAVTPLVVEAKTPSSYLTKVSVSGEKAWFMKRIKADPAHYDEEAILLHLAELQENPALGHAHFKIIVAAAITAAKAMRKKQLVSRLEESAATIS